MVTKHPSQPTNNSPLSEKIKALLLWQRARGLITPILGTAAGNALEAPPQATLNNGSALTLRAPHTHENLQELPEHREATPERPNSGQDMKGPTLQTETENSPQTEETVTEKPQGDLKGRRPDVEVALYEVLIHASPTNSAQNKDGGLSETRLVVAHPEENRSDILFLSTSSSWPQNHDSEPRRLLMKMAKAMNLPDRIIAHCQLAAPTDKLAATQKQQRQQADTTFPGPLSLNCKYLIVLDQTSLKRVGVSIPVEGFGSIRGQWLHINAKNKVGEFKILATWHPAKLIVQPSLKKDAWTDLQLIISSCKKNS